MRAARYTVQRMAQAKAPALCLPALCVVVVWHPDGCSPWCPVVTTEAVLSSWQQSSQPLVKISANGTSNTFSCLKACKCSRWAALLQHHVCTVMCAMILLLFLHVLLTHVRVQFCIKCAWCHACWHDVAMHVIWHKVPLLSA